MNSDCNTCGMLCLGLSAVATWQRPILRSGDALSSPSPSGRINDPQISLTRQIKEAGPVRIIQNDISNKLSQVTIAAPITSTVRFPLNPVHVLLAANQLTGLSVTSVAIFNQIRAIDRTRLLKRLGVVDADTLAQVDHARKISMGLIDLSQPFRVMI